MTVTLTSTSVETVRIGSIVNTVCSYVEDFQLKQAEMQYEVIEFVNNRVIGKPLPGQRVTEEGPLFVWTVVKY